MTLPTLQNYHIRREICNRFGFTVYEAVNEKTGKKNFIKVLDEKVAQNGVNVFHFLNAARMTKLMNCPDVHEVYHYGRVDAHFIIESEPVSANSLSLLLQEEFPLSIPRIVTLTTTISEILRFAHLRGMVHGLLNPNSIFVQDDSDLKIDDFGQYWILPHLRRQPNSEASLLCYYAAPELYFGKQKIDGRADVYSLGVILLQLLIDDIPIASHVNAGLKYNHLMQSLPNVKKMFPSHFKSLENILRKTLHKYPEFRYQNMKQVIRDLNELKEEFEMQQNSVSFVENF